MTSKAKTGEKTAGFRAQTGQVCFKFSPIETDGSRYNPLAEVRIFTLRDVCRRPKRRQHPSSKRRRIQRTPTGRKPQRPWAPAWCCACATRRRSEARSHVLPIFPTPSLPPGIDFREALIELENFPHDPEFKLGWTTPTGERTATHPMVAGKSKADAQQGGEGLEWCGLMRDHFSCSLLRPVGTPQHRSERLSHQRPRELRAPGIALSRCSQQRP